MAHTLTAYEQRISAKLSKRHNAAVFVFYDGRWIAHFHGKPGTGYGSTPELAVENLVNENERWLTS